MIYLRWQSPWPLINSEDTNLARNIYSDLNVDHKWQIEIAATLSQIGCVTLPDDILIRSTKDLVLSEDENFMFSITLLWHQR
jgi:hypothetical protein